MDLGTVVPAIGALSVLVAVIGYLIKMNATDRAEYRSDRASLSRQLADANADIDRERTARRAAEDEAAAARRAQKRMHDDR